MPVNIHGKEYRTVAERINEFHDTEKYKNWCIETNIVSSEGGECIIKAVISDEAGRIRETGLAHEIQGAGNINKTSHVENCETSAIGRALANIGLAGTEYASADEVGNAVINQAIMDATGRLKACMAAVMQYHDSIMAIKEGIATNSLSSAAEEWFGLDEEIKKALWISKKDGGPWEPKEREIMKSAEFRQSHFGEDL